MPSGHRRPQGRGRAAHDIDHSTHARLLFAEVRPPEDLEAWAARLHAAAPAAMADTPPPSTAVESLSRKERVKLLATREEMGLALFLRDDVVRIPETSADRRGRGRKAKRGPEDKTVHKIASPA